VNPLKILITAGPTVEFIDPVRFISNLSTGHMGYELVKASKKRSKKVTLISGLINIKRAAGVKYILAVTARDMQKSVKKELKRNNVLIMASAVADFKPKSFSKRKVKSKSTFNLKLTKNTDILKSLSTKDRKNKIIVGFALETENLIENARKKLKNKSLDLIIANKATREMSPFGKGKKNVYLIDRAGKQKCLKGVTKGVIARAILDRVDELCYTSNKYA